MTPEYLRPKAAAELFGLSRITIYRWIEARQVPSYKVGGATLLKVSELRAFVESHVREAIA